MIRKTKPKATSRKQYIALYKKILSANNVPEDCITLALERAYPASSAEVQRELFFRGLMASDWDTRTFACNGKNGVRMIGHSRVWSAKNIDRFAKELEAAGKFTPAAIKLAEQGKTTHEAFDAMEQRFAPGILENLLS